MRFRNFRCLAITTNLGGVGKRPWQINPKTGIGEGDKPQIPQISQITETKAFSADGQRNSSGTKKSW